MQIDHQEIQTINACFVLAAPEDRCSDSYIVKGCETFSDNNEGFDVIFYLPAVYCDKEGNEQYYVTREEYLKFRPGTSESTLNTMYNRRSIVVALQDTRCYNNGSFKLGKYKFKFTSVEAEVKLSVDFE